MTATGLPLSFLSWAYVLQGVYFWAYGTPGVSIFGVFVRQALPFRRNFRPTRNDEDVGLYTVQGGPKIGTIFVRLNCTEH